MIESPYVFHSIKYFVFVVANQYQMLNCVLSGTDWRPLTYE